MRTLNAGPLQLNKPRKQTLSTAPFGDGFYLPAHFQAGIDLPNPLPVTMKLCFPLSGPTVVPGEWLWRHREGQEC